MTTIHGQRLTTFDISPVSFAVTAPELLGMANKGAAACARATGIIGN